MRPNARDERQVATHHRVFNRARECCVARIKPRIIPRFDARIRRRCSRIGEIGKAQRLREDAFERDLTCGVTNGCISIHARLGSRTAFFGALTALPAPFLSAAAMSVFSQLKVPLPPSPGSRPKWPWLEVGE